MSVAHSLMFSCALLFCTGVAAQFYPPTSNERPAEGWPVDVVEIYQPIVTDTTLLFPVPWLVWQCTCSWPIDYEFYYEVDWRNVRMCWGRKEVFDRVAVNGQYSFVQRGVGELHAIIEESSGGFVYKEIPGDDAEPTRTVSLHWDTDKVVRTDTAAITHWGREGYVTLLTRYVELKPVR